MHFLTFVFSLITFVVLLQAEEMKKKFPEIFKKCAEANGFKMAEQRMKEMQEAHKRGENPVRSAGGPSSEELCTQRCVWKEKGFLSGPDIVIKKIKEDKVMIDVIKKENIDEFLECLKPLKIKECSDMKKILACKKD